MNAAALWVTFRQPGYHAWPDGPEYLASRHRHLFYVRVTVHDTAINSERSIEFHELLEHSKTVMRDVAVRTHEWDYGDKSCEQIAYAMAARLCRFYKHRVSVTVSEDGECGAQVSVADPDESE